MTNTVLGVIGGSGVYGIDGLENQRWERVRSPWGEASDELLFGRRQDIAPGARLHGDAVGRAGLEARFDELLAGRPGMSQEDVERLRALRGLDRPISARYRCWLTGRGGGACEWLHAAQLQHLVYRPFTV